MASPVERWSYARPIVEIDAHEGRTIAVTDEGAVYTRDDETGAWERTVRALEGGYVVATSQLTGAHLLFHDAASNERVILELDGDRWAELMRLDGDAMHTVSGAFAIVDGHVVGWSGYGTLQYSADGVHWEELELEGLAHGLLLTAQLHWVAGALHLTSDEGVWRIDPARASARLIDARDAGVATAHGDVLHVEGADGLGVAFDLSGDAPRVIERRESGLGAQAGIASLATDGANLVAMAPARGLTRRLPGAREQGSWQQVSPTRQSLRDVARVGAVTFALTHSGELHWSTGDDVWSAPVALYAHPSPIDSIAAHGDKLAITTPTGDVYGAYVDEDERTLRWLGHGHLLRPMRWIESDGVHLLVAPEARDVIHGGGLYVAQGDLIAVPFWDALHDALPERRSIHYTVPGDAHVSSLALAEGDWWAAGANIGLRHSSDDGASWEDRTPEGFELRERASDPWSSHAMPTPYEYWVERVGDEGVMLADEHTLWWSADEGESWARTELPGRHLSGLSAVGALDERGLLATRDGALFTLDPGAASGRLEPVGEWSWGVVRTIEPAEGGRALLATERGIVTLAME